MKTIIRKILTAIQILLTKPDRFVPRLQDHLHQKRMLTQLRRNLRGSGKDVIYVQRGTLLLPFHDDGDHQELYYHIHGDAWSVGETQLLKRFLKPGDHFVDVGANLGFITTIASQIVGENGIVHSFEPSPVVHTKLLGMIHENGLKNVVPHELGCGDAAAEMILASPNQSSGNATLTQTPGAGPIQTVKIVRLDDYLTPKLNRLDFLKIDTEGFEYHVLEGGASLIDTFHPTIYIELTHDYLESSQKSIQWLRSHGYLFEEEPDLTCAHNGSNFFAIHQSRMPPQSCL